MSNVSVLNCSIVLSSFLEMWRSSSSLNDACFITRDDFCEHVYEPFHDIKGNVFRMPFCSWVRFFATIFAHTLVIVNSECNICHTVSQLMFTMSVLKENLWAKRQNQSTYPIIKRFLYNQNKFKPKEWTKLMNWGFE